MINMWEGSEEMEGGAAGEWGKVTERRDEILKAVREEPANVGHCPRQLP